MPRGAQGAGALWPIAACSRGFPQSLEVEGVQLKKHSSAGFRIPHTGFVVKSKFPLYFLLFFFNIKMSLAHSAHLCGGAGRSTWAQGAGESSLPEQPVTVLDADREEGQEQSRDRQPVLLGKPAAPSALLLGTGSRIIRLWTSFTSHPACGITVGAPLWV